MVQIRRAHDADWPAIADVQQAARLYENEVALDGRAPAPIVAFEEARGLFSGDAWVAEKEGTVVGFIAANDDEIVWLYVCPAHHRRGIGRLLVNTVLSRRPMGLSVKTLSRNGPALGLYRSIGFSQVRSEPLKLPGIAEPLESVTLRSRA